MTGLTTHAANKALDFLFDGEFYAGLLTAEWDETLAREPRTGKYERQPILFEKAADGTREMAGDPLLWINAGTKEWPVQAVAVFDSKSGGEVVAANNIEKTPVKMDGVFKLVDLRVSIKTG